MALLGKILFENIDKISPRSGEVIGDVIIGKEYLQIRTYAMGDQERERGSKQNIQFNKKMAEEFKKILEQFINQP
ncbi:hypothetical protein [Algoriphagus aquimarinus]|uniref:Uncharacterized protein n=1 Tax=Algoriphagus aquimarinus TaxID=237018 RepID=A0A5C7ATH3_9BACT|nr:hypothetical protein [Algoriphagus aquimarinus]TXE11404.1 hypothetical protein ESV85_10795 [Algoriphagus aquimarinus]